MNAQRKRALTASLLLILSSLAGCLGNDIVEDEVVNEESLGTVLVSTYHVGELASAVGGDLVNVEMMSTMNVPVHDYEPSASDLIRLNQADVFFYHGLGLEPWVEGALANMDADGPITASTHAMPTGEASLDFQFLGHELVLRRRALGAALDGRGDRRREALRRELQLRQRVGHPEPPY